MTDSGWLPSRKLAERHGGLLALGGHPVVDMPAHVVEAAARAAARPVYPPTLGLRDLRAAIAERVGVELGRTVDPDRNVLVTVGGMQALFLAATVAGKAVVSHAPAFFFPQLVAACGGRCVGTGGDDGAPDWEAFAAAIGPETSLAIVNTPVNPTGYVFREADLEGIARALAGSRFPLLADEAYLGVLYDGGAHVSPATHPDLAGRTLLVRSFSKTYGLAAWRIGFAVGPEPLVSTMAKVLQWQTIAVDAVAQAAALAALTGPQGWIAEAVRELAEVRTRAVAAANATGLLRAELPEAGAFVWAAIDGRARGDSTQALDEEAVSEALARDHGIPAVPGRAFGARSPHLRIPFGGRPEAQAAFLERLQAVAASAETC